jgi:hypothetical protein
MCRALRGPYTQAYDQQHSHSFQPCKCIPGPALSRLF